MTLTERFFVLENAVNRLQSTNSIVAKRMILKSLPKEMDEDIQYILEILAGQHKFGFTYITIEQEYVDELPEEFNKYTIKEYLRPLNKCNLLNDWSTRNIIVCCQACRWFSHLVEPIVNRKLKLGIGKSVLPKDGLSVMLAKSYEGQILNNPVFVTEKLDGNRCIARFDGLKWCFTSRNGKPMNVQFDMTGLPTEYIYDGEILSDDQTYTSLKMTAYLKGNLAEKYVQEERAFNKTTGLINSKYGDKSNLVYNIFDIMADDLSYADRRDILDLIHADFIGVEHKDWRILPVLAYYRPDAIDGIHDLLDTVTSFGAEGLMLNLADGAYQRKRTNDILKYKKVKTMDLKVVDIQYGNGKYEGMVGALECAGQFDNKFVQVQVGSGLSDEQRETWALNPELIIGKIVEIAYFSESQNKDTSGTVYYSLRFPRLKCVRNDKLEVSKY